MTLSGRGGSLPPRPSRRKPFATMRSTIPLLSAILLLLGLPAALVLAQDKPGMNAAQALADAYQLTNADGDHVCPMTLTAQPRKHDPALKTAEAGATPPVMFDISFDKTACGAAILFSVDIASWTPGPGNSIQLNTHDGKLLAEFTEGVGGNWEALREGDGVYFLVNQRIADPASQAQPSEMFGVWDLARTVGRPACRVRFSDAPARPDAFRLDPDAGCNLLFGRFNPERWRLERGDLVLEAASGAKLRFAPSEEGGWGKVPEDNRPLYLTRAAQ